LFASTKAVFFKVGASTVFVVVGNSAIFIAERAKFGKRAKFESCWEGARAKFGKRAKFEGCWEGTFTGKKQTWARGQSSVRGQSSSVAGQEISVHIHCCTTSINYQGGQLATHEHGVLGPRIKPVQVEKIAC
jgi:hypothetical protein